MGLDYHLYCKKCDFHAEDTITEFSAVDCISLKVDCISLKYGQWEEAFRTWAEFLILHSGHGVQVLDAFGNESKPWKVRGGYILGIDKEVPR